MSSAAQPPDGRGMSGTGYWEGVPLSERDDRRMVDRIATWLRGDDAERIRAEAINDGVPPEDALAHAIEREFGASLVTAAADACLDGIEDRRLARGGPPCGCRKACGDLPEGDDFALAVCRGLPPNHELGCIND